MTFGIQSLSNIFPTVISAIVIIIMIFSLYVTVKYRNTEQYRKTRINVFFSSLANLAIIFVGFNIILTSVSFENDQRFTRLTKTKEAVDKLWLYPNRLLVSYRNLRPEFIASFFMSNLELYNMVLLPGKKTIPTQLSIIEEQYISHVMVQAWEDCLALRADDSTPMHSWLVSFLAWAQNPYFKNNFQRIKFEYADTTIMLGDLLFEYAAKLPQPTSNTALYGKAVDQLMQEPRFLKVIQNAP